jgi:hypothetical protein
VGAWACHQRKNGPPPRGAEADQVVAHEIRSFSRRATRVQVRLRREHAEAERAEALGHEPGFPRARQAQGHVRLAGSQVDDRVVDDELHAQAGVARAQRTEAVGEPERAQRLRGRDAHHPLDLHEVVGAATRRFACRGAHGAHVLQHALAGGRRGYALAAAHEQARAERRLQLGYVAADGGLADA